MAVISRFGLDEKKEIKRIRRLAFYFVFLKKMVKNKKLAPWQQFFLYEEIKNVYFNFDFSFLHFASNEINPGARKLILIFNFH